MASDPKKPRAEEEPRASERLRSVAGRVKVANIVIEDDGSINFTPLLGAFAQTYEDVAALLALFRNLEKVEIEWCVIPEAVNFRLMRDWMQIVTILHNLPSLPPIQLTARRLDYPHADFIVDSLPDRVTRLDTDALRIATLFRKRATPFESVKFADLFNDHEHDGYYLEDSYLADVFRLKSRCIDLTLWDEWPSAELLNQECGPFDRNEHLQELHLFVSFGSLPEALRHLRALNGNFKLICNADWKVDIEDRFRELDQVADIEDDAKEFVARMRDAGLTLNDAELRVHIKDEQKWMHAPRGPLIDYAQWTREDTFPSPCSLQRVPTGSLVHEGIRILFCLEK